MKLEDSLFRVQLGEAKNMLNSNIHFSNYGVGLIGSAVLEGAVTGVLKFHKKNKPIDLIDLPLTKDCIDTQKRKKIFYDKLRQFQTKFK